MKRCIKVENFVKHKRRGKGNIAMGKQKNESPKIANQQVLQKYNLYSRDIRRLLLVSGIWPDLHPIIQRVVSYYAFASISFSFMGAINFSFHHVKDLMVFIQTVGLAIAMPGILMKIYLFLKYRDDLAKLNTDLSAHFLEDLKNEIYVPLALSHYKPFAYLAYALTTVVGITSSLPSLRPLLSLIHGKYVPVIPTIYPFPYEPGSLVYWLLQIIFMSTAFFIWSVTCGVDSILGQYALQMCGELRILAYRFENLRMSVDYDRELKECVQRHYLLLRSRDALEKIFGYPVIWLAITSALIQCTLVFQLSEVLKTMNASKMLYIAAYISLKLVQAYMYAWYGNLISHESNLCLDAMYNSYWAGSGDTKFMRDVLIVISQRPLDFTAIGCLRVKMEMFAKIVQTSVSYFCLLQTLEKKEK